MRYGDNRAMAAEERQWQYLTPAGDKRVRGVSDWSGPKPLVPIICLCLLAYRSPPLHTDRRTPLLINNAHRRHALPPHAGALPGIDADAHARQETAGPGLLLLLLVRSCRDRVSSSPPPPQRTDR